MKRDYSISVAMATYNGEEFIKKQIDSIIVQLNPDDEIIISDDGSTDHTISIVKSYKDKRIKVIAGPKKGVKQNFANAIEHCKGKYIFLSDQDDIWMPNKVRTVLNTFEEKKCVCVVHDCIVFDSNKKEILYNSFFEYRNSGSGIIKNIIKNTYIGCCMTIDSNLKKYILPIPNNIEMHDQWIGLISEKNGKSLFIDDKLIQYRRHNSNVTKMKSYSFYVMISNRAKLILELLKKIWR